MGIGILPGEDVLSGISLPPLRDRNDVILPGEDVHHRHFEGAEGFVQVFSGDVRPMNLHVHYGLTVPGLTTIMNSWMKGKQKATLPGDPCI